MMRYGRFLISCWVDVVDGREGVVFEAYKFDGGLLGMRCGV